MITALTTMGKILGDTSNIAGGTSGAIQTNFNDSVTNAFSTPPKAAMVFEARLRRRRDRVVDQGEAADGLQHVHVPVDRRPKYSNAVEIAGDLIVTFRDNPAIRAFDEVPRRRRSPRQRGPSRAASGPATTR